MNQSNMEIREHIPLKRPYILAAVMLAMFLNAIEATIVSTAMPAIVNELGGFSQYSWVFSGYLLMNTVTVLIYGKLSDLFGRKSIFLFGTIIFLIGSLLCGFAETLPQLIMYRLIQGLGAGAIAPVSMTIIGDIYDKEERAHIQGYLSSVWGISAIMGPALGGLMVESLSWRYIFWMNIPLGILSIMGIWFFLHENIEKKKQDIDYKGAILLTIGISTFMLLLVEGGVRWAWNSWPILLLAMITFVTLFLFVKVEKKAVNPMMPFTIWRDRVIFIVNMVSFITGMVIIGLSSFLPTFVQGVMERSATVAGLTLTTMSIGWPIASTLAGRLLLKIGFKMTALIGGISLMAGCLILVLMKPENGPLMAASGSFFVGIGMGLTSTSFIVLIQDMVNWEQRGIATASNQFMLSIGNTVGAALLGGILNSRFQAYLSEHTFPGENVTLNTANQLLNEAARNQLSNHIVTVLQNGLTISLHTVYLIVLLFAIISFILLLLVGNKQVKKP